MPELPPNHCSFKLSVLRKELRHIKVLWEDIGFISHSSALEEDQAQNKGEGNFPDLGEGITAVESLVSFV